MQHPFKLKNAALLMALAAAYPLTAYSTAGVAQFTTGEVNVRRGNAAVPLMKGRTIDSGDSIVTGSAGQAQIRFSDGGLVSLSPNSQFNITNYADANDGDKDSFAVSLLRGGMRAITGLIGKRNRENYKVTTSTATIGIRGSAFSASYNSDGSVNVAGEQDTIQVCTQSGCVDLTVGEIVRVSSPDSIPNRTNLRTNLPPLAILPQTGAQKNQPEFDIDTGINGVLPAVSALFSSGADAYLFDYSPRGGSDPSTGQGSFVNSLMTRHVASTNPLAELVEQVGSGSDSFGTVGTANDPAFIGWGYWTNGRIVYGGNEGTDNLVDVHYVVGRPTPIAQMPQTGTAQYALVGGTNPTANNYSGNSRLVGQLISAGLSVEFSTGLVNAVINTRFVSNGNPVNVQISDVGYVDGNSFYANNYDDSDYSGFFTGDQAQRAGLIYYTYDDTVGDVTGAAVFQKAGSAPSITDMVALFVDDSNVLGLTSPIPGTTFLVGNSLVAQSYDDFGYYGGSSLIAATSPVTSSGSLGSPNDANFIGWGYWAKGFEAYNGDSLSGVHYIVGRPTLNMPTSGTATYSMAGGTAPTSTYQGVSIVGTLLSASLTVNFGSNSVFADVNTQFTKNNQTSQVRLQEFATISGARFSGGGSCGGNVSGIFVGDAAARAGMVYKQNAAACCNNSSPTLGIVRGAVAFTRDANP